MLIKYFLLLITSGYIVTSSPLPGKKDAGHVLYDQRQEGEWNVHADLKNFIILILPTASTSAKPTGSPSSSDYSSLFGGPSLLDFDTLISPTRSQLKRIKHKNPSSAKDYSNSNNNNAAAEETKHFIEAKTAPYHVDISTTRDHLAKLHPEPAQSEEIYIARSPSVALVKNTEQPILQPIQRVSRAFLLTIPSNGKSILTEIDQDKRAAKKDVKKKTIKEGAKDSFKLLGAENEQCGPGMARDSYGNCRPYKN